jgi:hypothetical protein
MNPQQKKFRPLTAPATKLGIDSIFVPASRDFSANPIISMNYLLLDRQGYSSQQINAQTSVNSTNHNPLSRNRDVPRIPPPNLTNTNLLLVTRHSKQSGRGVCHMILSHSRVRSGRNSEGKRKFQWRDGCRWLKLLYLTG